MKKINTGILGGIVVAAFAVVALMAHASTAPTVSCSTSVSGNQVTWTATSTGGNPPYSFLWMDGSGVTSTSSVDGSTSTAITATYGVNGTYGEMIQVMDASSSVATSTCSAVVTSNAVVAPTSTLNVFTVVNNTAGGSAVPSNFTDMVSGAAANPSSFAGNASGTMVTVNASTTYSVSVSMMTNYTMTESGTCSGPLAAGTTASCTMTETFVAPVVTPPTPTSTPPLPRVNPPSLSIGPNGAFLAHGMIVTSVASGSFQGTVWGITYTVIWSGNLPEFYFRLGNTAGMGTDPSGQLVVGDEVGVSGRVSSSSPMTVIGNVIRDYSIIQLRPGKREGQPSSPFYNGKGNGGGEDNNGVVIMNGGTTTIATSSSSSDMGGRLNDLLNQLHNLQNLFNHGNGNGNGNGNGKGNGNDQ